MAALAVNIDRLWKDIETLATFSAGDEGVNRLTFSDQDWAARAYLRAQMASVGLRSWMIPPGVMLGRLSPLFELRACGDVGFPYRCCRPRLDDSTVLSGW